MKRALLTLFVALTVVGMTISPAMALPDQANENADDAPVGLEDDEEDEDEEEEEDDDEEDDEDDDEDDEDEEEDDEEE